MKLTRKRFLWLVCLLALISGFLIYAAYQESPLASQAVQSPLEITALQTALAEQEQILTQSREELANLLVAFYQGQASEEETQALVDQVEAERLQVENLRKQLSALQEQPSR